MYSHIVKQLYFPLGEENECLISAEMQLTVKCSKVH